MSELKPCPFCGGTNISMVEELSEKERCAVSYVNLRCTELNCCMPEQRLSYCNEADAIKAWNNRPIENKQKALLKEAVDTLKACRTYLEIHNMRKDNIFHKTLEVINKVKDMNNE